MSVGSFLRRAHKKSIASGGTVQLARHKLHYTFLFLVMNSQITIQFISRKIIRVYITRFGLSRFNCFLNTTRFLFYILSRTGKERGAKDLITLITSFGLFRIVLRHPPSYITLFPPASYELRITGNCAPLFYSLYLILLTVWRWSSVSDAGRDSWRVLTRTTFPFLVQN